MKKRYSFICIMLILLMTISCKEVEENKIVYNSITKIDGKGLISYNTSNKEVVVKDVNSNKIIFSKKINRISSVKPVLLDNKLFTVLNDTTFVCVDILSKRQLVKIDLNSKVMDFQHIGGLKFLLNIDNYGIVLVNMANGGNIVYNVFYDYDICNTPDMSPYSIAFNDKCFFVADFNCKTISAIEISTGKIVWDKIIDSKTTTSNLFYYKNKLFIGINYYYKGGKIVVVNASTGDLMKEIECNFESRFSAIFNKNKIYYYTYFGDLNKSSIYEFNLSTMANKEICSFNKNNDVSGRPVQLLDDYLYFTDNENFLNKVNVKTLKKSKIRKSDEILYGIFKKDKKINFIWGNGTITPLFPSMRYR